MIYFLSSLEINAKLLEVLPYRMKKLATILVSPSHIDAAIGLRDGRLGHPQLDMREFLKICSIFIHIPKSAGNSIREQLYGGYACGHTTLYWYTLALSLGEINDSFIYTIFRNPWDRIHSAY